MDETSISKMIEEQKAETAKRQANLPEIQRAPVKGGKGVPGKSSGRFSNINPLDWTTQNYRVTTQAVDQSAVNVDYAPAYATFAANIGNINSNTILFLGHSIIRDMKNLDAANWAKFGANAVNYGIGGDTSQGVLFRLPSEIDAVHAPKVVVLMITVNDFANYNQLGLNGIAAMSHDLVAAIRLRTNFKSKVLFIASLPANFTVPFSANVNMLKSLNTIQQANIPTENGSVVFVNYFDRFIDGSGNLLLQYYGDPGPTNYIHPNADGQRLFFDDLQTQISRM